jgi:multiple sugar transport system substrate-binding protein
MARLFRSRAISSGGRLHGRPQPRHGQSLRALPLSEGWLAHYLDFAGERFLPPMSKLLDQPFWLDPRDPHRMAAVMQIASRPLAHNYAAASGEWRHDLVEQEYVWAKAIHRVAAEGISPEQAVDEAIARIKQILSQ